MLPESFLTKEISDYICHTCKTKIKSKVVDEMMERIGQSLATMKKNDPIACRQFINENRIKLAKHHYYMVDVKLALAQMLGQEKGVITLSEEDLEEKLNFCEELNDLFKQLAPAENRVRGLLLFELHSAIMEKARRQTSDDNKIILLRASKRRLSQSYELLVYEPEILPEGKIARMAKGYMNSLDQIITSLYNKVNNIIDNPSIATPAMLPKEDEKKITEKDGNSSDKKNERL